MKNNHEVIGSVVRIYFSGKYSVKFPFALIDVADLDAVSKINWNVDFNGYVLGKKSGKSIRLHNLLLPAKSKKEPVDHLNRDRTDNRRLNLHYTTQSFNAANRTGAMGVSWNKALKRWHAHIRVNYKRIHLGFFKEKGAAIQARSTARQKYFSLS